MGVRGQLSLARRCHCFPTCRASMNLKTVRSPLLCTHSVFTVSCLPLYIHGSVQKKEKKQKPAHGEIPMPNIQSTQHWISHRVKPGSDALGISRPKTLPHLGGTQWTQRLQRGATDHVSPLSCLVFVSTACKPDVRGQSVTLSFLSAIRVLSSKQRPEDVTAVISDYLYKI